MKTSPLTMLCDTAGVAGAALIAIGVGLIYMPAGLIVGGLLLLIAAIVGSKTA